MDHARIYRKLSPYIDNELSPADRAAVESHLGSCSDCRSELADLGSQRVYLKGAEVTGVPADFRACINEAIEAQKPGRGMLPLWKLLPVPAALTVAILVFSAYMIAAPVAYGMNGTAGKIAAHDMAGKVLAAGLGGSLFAPAAFAKFCGACTANACICCGDKCGPECRMGKEEVSHGK